MSYTKQTWQTGDTITAEKLNHIEDGVDDLSRHLSDLDIDKQDAPATAGTAGQVLGLDNNLDPVWVNQSGGGGGTTDYAQLSNKPTINNVELSGNKTLAELGINAGSVGFDETETYTDGSVGKELSDQKNAIGQKADKTTYVTLSGTQVTQVGADNTMYLCGELAELTFTAPETGITAIRFTSGTTPTVATFSGVTWLNEFDPSALEASKTYEVNILYGVGVASWT